MTVSLDHQKSQPLFIEDTSNFRCAHMQLCDHKFGYDDVAKNICDPYPKGFGNNLPCNTKLELVRPSDVPLLVLDAVHVYVSEVMNDVGQISRMDTT